MSDPFSSLIVDLGDSSPTARAFVEPSKRAHVLLYGAHGLALHIVHDDPNALHDLLTALALQLGDSTLDDQRCRSCRNYGVLDDDHLCGACRATARRLIDRALRQ